MKNQLKLCISTLFLLVKSAIVLLYKKNGYKQFSKKVAIILGNGPSLRDDIQRLRELASIDNNIIYSVGSFPTTDYYTQVRPRFYIIADSYFWDKAQPTSYLMKIMDSINERTVWPLTIYLPHDTRKFKMESIINNPLVTINYYNKNQSVQGYKKVLYWLYDLKLAIPIIQNVVSMSIMLAIYNEHSKIYLYGVDHNWHQNLRVDDTNQVVLVNEYFYDKEKKYEKFVSNPVNDEYFDMASLFGAISNMFLGYKIISEYAQKKGVKIFNATADSNIDSFERSKL